MQELLARTARSRCALYSGAWLLGLALFFGIYHLGTTAPSTNRNQQELAAASDNCLAVSRETVTRMVGSLPGTLVSVALAKDAVQRLATGEFACRTVADVRPPNTALVARYDLTLATRDGAFVLTAWRPHG